VPASGTLTPSSASPCSSDPREILKLCLLAREIDRLEAEFTARGEAFFHVAGVGHAASIALAPHLLPTDLLHLHYRDKALMLARGISAEQFFLSLFCKATSHSAGRQMSAHMAAPELGVLSLVGPVGNNALQAVGAAAVLQRRTGQPSPSAPVVICAMGDGTTQQGEALEAISHAVRDRLPVLFLIEDNQLAISVRTQGRTFYHTPDGAQTHFLRRPIHRVDGRHILQAGEQFGDLLQAIRSGDGPAIVVLEVERLTDHTNADSQASYRDPEEVARARREADPTDILLAELISARILTPEEGSELATEARRLAFEAAQQARRAPEPEPSRQALPPWPELADLPYPLAGSQITTRQPTMLEAIRDTLDARLAQDDRVTLFGQDIEDPKGDVFGITRGLSTRHGADRVTNAPLAESTIVGVAVGRALAGERPVAMLQFADFVPIAFNQIACEMATIPWRTADAMAMPVVVMAPCGAYRPGLGHFHAQTNDSLLAHVPGLDVAMPANPADAAGLLNAALASGRPTAFLYPKALLNDRAVAASCPPFDPASHLVPFGQAAIVRPGRDVTLLGWGNTVGLCRAAADDLVRAGVEAEVIDLRTLAPWDCATVLASTRRTGHLIVVHEDNHSAGFGAEVLATVLEQSPQPVAARRVTRPDVPIPCHYPSQLEVLPSVGAIVGAVADLLGLPHEPDQILSDDGSAEDTIAIPAIGTSPTDERITVTRWLVKPGDLIQPGTLVADIEADKANGELASPAGGIVASLSVPAGESLQVGECLLRLRPADQGQSAPEGTVASARYQPKRRRLLAPFDPALRRRNAAPAAATTIWTSHTFGAPGSRIETNEQLLQRFPGRTHQEIMDSCGVASRVTAGPGESVTTLAWRAVQKVNAAHPGFAAQLGLVIAATETADTGCPSLAALSLLEVQRLHGSPVTAAAFDLNAACSGWLYALHMAHDHLARHPQQLALIITADVLTPLLAPDDFSTRILFGDAATATLVGTPESFALAGVSPALQLDRPVILGHADSDGALTCPTPARLDHQRLHMNGPRVYREAVKAMALALRAACVGSQLTPDDLHLVVPHQANQRILDAVERALQLDGRVYSAIARTGNTSASSIPLALETLLADRQVSPAGRHRSAQAALANHPQPVTSSAQPAAAPHGGESLAPEDSGSPATPKTLGLVAFGGGFTYAAAIARLIPQT
jgi:2-oxoisovalerate dehydrogenase E1 component